MYKKKPKKKIFLGIMVIEDKKKYLIKNVGMIVIAIK